MAEKNDVIYVDQHGYEEALKNIERLKKDFNIYLSSNKIIINYMEKEYVITISTYDDSHYWHLSPYNKSFFETKFTNNKNDFEILLFVIKENQLIYERNEKY